MDNIDVLRDKTELEIENIVALKRVFSTQDGKKALDVIKHFSLYGSQAYVPTMPSEHTAFRCGCQQVWLDLEAMLNIDMEELKNRFENAQTKEESYEL